MKIIRTTYLNPAFKELVAQLNKDLANRDGKNHPLSQFNEITHLKHVVLAYHEGKAVGCGAIAKTDLSAIEIKRMYVIPTHRGQHLGENILTELENWIKELGHSKCILFMGVNQPEAIKLYLRNNFSVIENYGKLKDIPDSICLAKKLL
ncbi:GNAT family N-acetyltransferase [Flavobacteriaceae bacterium]|nr:GNAT family N-acetyltransferase [Flavobacteriaceae bacterium]MDB2685562.1 GNAT family N-acetyltransferase [Flavobacteriaceae bacterium]MDB4256928.1 GNAT family N-acetyltransferase [Flavobacteriaceae bacterium]MDC0636586.1 GNAT family N-acetyltransferase [Flavobacteriaceae bacterium]